MAVSNPAVRQLFTFEDEVSFWGLQIKEHMLFIYQGLVEDEVEKQTKIVINGNSINLKDEAMVLHYLWKNLVVSPNIDVNSVLEAIDKTQKYQLRVQNIIKNGIWIGWLSFSFIEHLIMELSYFHNKIINNNYNLADEITFWLWHHESEMSAVEKLLDPLEIDLSEMIKNFSEKVKILEADLIILQNGNNDKDNESQFNSYTTDILFEYLNLTDMVRTGIEAANILTNISPKLINHVIREGERAIVIFNFLLTN